MRKVAHDSFGCLLMKVVVCLTFFFSSMISAATRFPFDADSSLLASQQEWLNLLHVRDGVSEIDDPHFFFVSER